MSTSTKAAFQRVVFMTGGTGYIGSRVIPALLARGHKVKALVRESSASRLPTGCLPVFGNALDSTTFVDDALGCDTFLHLVGTPHPSPSKAAEFERVDFVSARESVRVADAANISHFIYLSVAEAAQVMRAYVDVRMRGEALVRDSIENGAVRSATFVRPWYVLGPGHRWPYALVPLYWIMGAIPATRERAKALGLVTIDQMVRTLVSCVEHPPPVERVIAVPDIRRA